ncbi:LuxR C-terminal-related transcriptional regulator [Flavobacterium sp. MK4S-17]|uniref:LuxR C-terminal-related transcriptional regulator n=1 Tax=Flavobacterium sp. MK4S-17 TaxID=2543737 RepID=UPI0013588C93|nr:LuxR C-terminal-related transcriptional regulator [Flavobacterium sp. MK4S-17]
MVVIFLFFVFLKFANDLYLVNMEIVKFNEMKKTWHQIARHQDGSIPPSFELEIYKKMLDIFHVGSYYYYIVNIAQVQMEFVSDKIVPIIGITPEEFTVEYLFENMHPEDKPRFADYERKVAEFFNQLPPEKVLKYKVSYDYRLRCADGSYKWILMQTTTIQTNEEGAVIRVLGVQTDITHLKTDNKGSGLSFLGLDGEPSYYNVPINSTTLLPGKALFSDREKEVLRLVLSGKSTSEIAEILSLSVHTINSHRKHIFFKSGCSSLAELGSKSVKEGWI